MACEAEWHDAQAKRDEAEKEFAGLVQPTISESLRTPQLKSHHLRTPTVYIYFV